MDTVGCNCPLKYETVRACSSGVRGLGPSLMCLKDTEEGLRLKVKSIAFLTGQNTESNKLSVREYVSK